MKISAEPAWKAATVRSRVFGLLGVFSLFSIAAFANDIENLGRQRPLLLILTAIVQGCFPMAYAATGVVLRKNWWKAAIPIFIVHLAVINGLYRLIPLPPPPNQMGPADLAHLQARLYFSSTAIIIAMVLGYICFLIVIITETRRYFRVHAEIQLASEIHRTLVPVIDTTVRDFEFYGRSVPSGEVGGDLIDVVHDERGWIAYVADVSGHGVAPGVVMAMVKSAARMRLSNDGNSAGLLESLNSVLCSVTKPEMFVTFAYLASSGDRLHCAYSPAGHPAILRYHAASQSFSEVTCSNLPLGMFDQQSYASSTVDCGPGDIFLLLTDGLLEVADTKGDEFGLEGVKAVVAQRAGDPLPAMYQALTEAAHRYGRANDDQSVLIVRACGGPAITSA